MPTQNSKALVNALMMDLKPALFVAADFGLDGWGCDTEDNKKRYLSLQAAVKAGVIDAKRLDSCLHSDCPGAALTAVVNGYNKNPYPGIVFKTAFDDNSLGEGEDYDFRDFDEQDTLQED